MDRRRMTLFVAINVIVSVAATLLVLSLWESLRPAVTPIGVTQPTRPPDASPIPIVTEPPSPSLTPVPQGPFAYIIQAGDTLGSLALQFDVPLEDLLEANSLTEDAILSVGQELIIPIGGSTEIASTPNATSATAAATTGPALVVIREIASPGLISGETVILTNLGDVINLAGWTLSDGGDNRYTFPEVTLFADAEINLHSRAGDDTPSDLYWGEDEAVWGETGTVAFLRDTAGKLVATYRVP